jgi:hypothetical protein
MELRDQIEDIIRRRLGNRPHIADALNNDLTAAIRPVLTAKDAEIGQLNATIARVTALVEADEQCGPSIDRGVSCPNILDLDAALDQPGDQEGAGT